ncbi:MAG: hypothetical protein FWE35_02700 [Streptosporangiales bacterium]|nr:hypothetical protein [Streptosporangiales bacterium]
MKSPYESLSREQLAVLLPELLLIGHMIDRSGLIWCLDAFGQDEMTQVSIEEWMAASPVYTGRMQRALKFEGTDVVTIFKGIQLDIGAPPQFMDFRYTVHDPNHGEFQLDHCGALMDVEPMGEEMVRGMCHDIEDPTFDATAVATNPKAQVRPVHRPPRVPAGRTPHCQWTVTIDESHPEVYPSEGCLEVRQSRAATVELAPIDPADDGRADYSGPLLSDVDFAAFSKSALVRMADEVCLEMHLLNLGFIRAVRARADAARTREICVKQLTGLAGLASERIARALDLPADAGGALRVLELHPVFNPSVYVNATVDGGEIKAGGPSDSAADGTWISLCGPDEPKPLAAAVRGVDARLDVAYTGDSSGWTARVVTGPDAVDECEEVQVTRFSTGAGFAFQSGRKSIPITPV